jgi:hypothetical protein
MSRLLLAALLLTTLPACDDDRDYTSTGNPMFCPISWAGTLATDASVFVVRACWNGRCASDIVIQATARDAGPAAAGADAGCTPAPTTPGGLPSGCRAARTQTTPVTPETGCGEAEIGNQFSVRACVQAPVAGKTSFGVSLTPKRPSYPNLGGKSQLSIATQSSISLVASEGMVPSAEGTASACLGASFALDGTPIPP